MRLDGKNGKPQRRIWSRNEDRELLFLVSEGVAVDNISLKFPELTVEAILRRIQRLQSFELKWPSEIDDFIIACVA